MINNLIVVHAAQATSETDIRGVSSLAEDAAIKEGFTAVRVFGDR